MSEYDEPDDPQRTYDAHLPPQDMGAEQAVLGAMLISERAIDLALEVVVGPDFYRPAHETIWDAILDLYGRGEPVDMLTVAALMGQQGTLIRAGGAPFLHTLASEVPIAENAAHYGTIVAEAATRRRLVEASARIRQWAMSPEGDTDDLVDRAQAEMFAAIPRRSTEDYRAIGDVIDETVDMIDAASNRSSEDTGGVPTGFYDLDDLLGGLSPGQMIVVAGRPGSGKSTLALDICRSASIRHDLTSCIFSLEMTRHEIAMRLLSAEAKVPLSNLRSGKMGDGDWQRLSLAMGPVGRSPFYIDDSPNLNMTEIRAKARRLKQTVGLDLIAIDYMQLMTSGKKVENRQNEVSEFSRQIKLLAKELGLPIIALSQLNRGVEQRTVKRPMLSDLRESGSIEQDADIVILLHRDDMYEVESSRPGEADLIVAKHRNGATQDIAVAAQLHYSRFADLARN